MKYLHSEQRQTNRLKWFAILRTYLFNNINYSLSRVFSTWYTDQRKYKEKHG